MGFKSFYLSLLRKIYSIAHFKKERTVQEFQEFDVQSIINSVCTANDVLEAFHIFKDNIDVLRDWRILYACNDDRGSFKIARRSFGEKGIVSTAMRGRSLIVLDKEFVTSTAPTCYQIGYGIYADSNVASFIRRASYGGSKSQDLQQFLSGIRNVLSLKDLSNLNPYYYLWECQRSWDSKTHDACRENLASIIAMHHDDDPLGSGWSERFLNHHRKHCELAADKMIEDFLTEALAEETASRLCVIEAMIVRTKIIDGASKKSSAHKLVELIKFMCEELQVVLIRELVICSDILFKGNTGLTKKLNSIETQKDPLAVLQGCVWDVFMLRIMDAMATPKGLPFGEAYIPTLVSMDGDITSIIEMTELKALALCRKSGKAFPFLDINLEEWLKERTGAKRAEELRPLFAQESFEARAKNRSLETVKEIAMRDRNRLLAPRSSFDGVNRRRAK